MAEPEAREVAPSRPIDWRGWLALAWAVAFGSLYVRMVILERAPGLAAALRSMVAGH
ncbi:MAG TPA: hypothetical protein VGZ22_24355 [Isosphaeraceae bacterium]|jgi:hypothetical protein|nr:hypothetical protein [Isosphaeraceae bacterium]